MANQHQFRFITANGADELWERNIYKEVNRHHQAMGGPIDNEFDEVAHRIMQMTANNLGIIYTPSTTDTHVVHTFTHPTAHGLMEGIPTSKRESVSGRRTRELEEDHKERMARGGSTRYNSVDPSQTDEADIVRPFEP